MSYDIGLDENDDLPLHPVHITGDDLTIQRIRARVSTFLGEWVLDDTVGLNYLGWRAVKPPPLTQMRGTVRREVEGTDGVDRVLTDEITLLSENTVRYTASVQLASETVVGLTFDSGRSSGNAQPGIVITRASVS
jgi:hypothetical protein